GVLNPPLILVAYQLELSGVVDEVEPRPGPARLERFHQGALEFAARGEGLPPGVDTLVLAAPVHQQPRLVHITVVGRRRAQAGVEGTPGAGSLRRLRVWT